MKKLLITGASGFVGRTLLRMAGSGGIGSFGRIIALTDEVDLREQKSLNQALAQEVPDAVIHLAAISFVPDSIARPRETYEVNLHGTMNLLDALTEAGFCGAFLYVSSGDVYGAVPPESLPITEERLPAPRNPYSASKLAAEAYCQQLGRRKPIRMLVARPFNHIGPGQSARFAVAGFAKQIAEIKRGMRAPEIEVGNVDVTRDFSDVRDVVRAYVALLESGISGQDYNVCSGVERNVGEVLRQMLEIYDVRAAVKTVTDKVRPNEQTRHFGSNRKLCEHTGWKPAIPLEQSLKDLLDSWMTG
jgi:GDP-4-dehydro-6-deoxy-D-mannose reductase